MTAMSDCPVHAGHRIEDTITLDTEAIVAGARLLGDRNPLHSDPDAAAASRFGSLIACGPHVAGVHACMLPSHLTDLGVAMVGVDFTVRYERPVLPDVVHTMWWQVDTTEPRGRHWQVSWTGAVDAPTGRCIAAAGLILVLGS